MHLSLGFFFLSEFRKDVWIDQINHEQIRYCVLVFQLKKFATWLVTRARLGDIHIHLFHLFVAYCLQFLPGI